MNIVIALGRSVGVALALAAISACASAGHGAGAHGASVQPARGNDAAVAAADQAGARRNRLRLVALQAQRQSDAGGVDYRVGPGDVLAIKAYDLEELDRRVRVDGAGNVVLPLLETVPVAGKTIAEVEHDLTARLGAFMYSPKVTAFIEEYRSQQVAVVGAVERPGLVAQTNQTATVLDVIASAGGKTADATNRIYLIPAETRGGAAAPSAHAIAAASSECGDAGGGAPCPPPAGLGGDPIAFDANEMDQMAQATFLSLPVRGGDVVIVPGNGHFVVEGWVEKPGTYPMKAGLTLRGAIATAGGLSFPAEPSDVRVFRRAPNGAAETLRANLNDIAAQRAPDLFLHEGDVIEVSSSKVRLVSWGAYKVITDIVRASARIPIY
ncbi:MAG: polysaccharide biosynthesis/export family protein [Deltaproteobacteria bacterium]|nr:polysaccharide biosynthesis/export family protein [Deltaproteobacteria bacterium]